MEDESRAKNYMREVYGVRVAGQLHYFTWEDMEEAFLWGYRDALEDTQSALGGVNAEHGSKK